MNIHKLASVTFLLLAICSTPVFAAQDEPLKVEAEGTITLGDDSTIGQARVAALNNARRAALEKATGLEVRGSSTVYNFQLINDLVVTATKGIIVKENVLGKDCSSKDDFMTCSVRIEAWVKPLHLERRGSFKVKNATVLRAGKNEASANPVFNSGDEIMVKASANQEGYLHLFSVDHTVASASSIPTTCAMPNRWQQARSWSSPTILSAGAGSR